MEAKPRTARPPCCCSQDDPTDERQKRSQVWTATHLQLERVELLMPLLDACIAEVVGYARVKVRHGGVDGCGLQACRKSDLRLFVTHSQIRVSYACRQSLPYRALHQF